MGCGSSGSNGAGDSDLAVNSDGGSLDDLASGSGDLAPPDLLPPPPSWVYVSGNSATITRYTLDLQSGALTQKGTTTTTGQTSFLAIDAPRRHLFAVDEQNSKVEAFTVDASTGALTHVGTDPGSGGTGPAHLAVDATGKWVLTANYGSGDVAVLAVAADGSLGAPTALATAPGANAHQILLDRTNAFAWVPCLGSSHIAQFTFDAATGVLAPHMPVNVMTASGGGPRHLALTPDGKFAYLMEETASTMSNYSVDAGGNLVVAGQRLSTRAPNPTGTNSGAEVQVHPSGKFLYGSNRGDNDIVLFALASDGSMTYVANKSTGGQTPRHFSIDPGGKWLLVGNQGSNDVRVFAIDGTAGTLTPVGTPMTVTAPTFVGITSF
ncbi:MAG: 6-phosphogluconolactonase [Myxococcales bacterium]|nr:6-phosphogluconolactonase [Myxococcales bacterium]